MKQPSSNFQGEKQQPIKRFLATNAASKDQKDPIREPSTQGGFGRSTRSCSSRPNRLSTRNSDDSSVGQANRSQNVPDKAPGLADLIWKYFEPEIRDALLEAQESLGENNDEHKEQLSNRKQVGK
jgi:hypothetical protein